MIGKPSISLYMNYSKGKLPSSQFRRSFCISLLIWATTMILPSRHSLVQSQQWQHQNKVWNPFKVNDKGTRTMSSSSFFIFNFKQISHIVLASYSSKFWSWEDKLKIIFFITEGKNDLGLSGRSFFLKQIIPSPYLFHSKAVWLLLTILISEGRADWSNLSNTPFGFILAKGYWPLYGHNGGLFFEKASGTELETH